MGFWKSNPIPTFPTHSVFTLLLAKSALSCWMYPTVQITLSPTPSHPWIPQSDHKYF